MIKIAYKNRKEQVIRADKLILNDVGEVPQLCDLVEGHVLDPLVHM